MSYRNVLRIAAKGPWARKTDTRTPTAGQDEPLLPREPDDGYGSVNRPGSSSGRSSRRESPEVHRRESTLNIVPEEENVLESPASFEAEEAEAVEWDLEERGLYSGSSYTLL
jgi:hypothetical protein